MLDMETSIHILGSVACIQLTITNITMS